MKIEILGPGCAKCKQLYENAREAVKQAGVQAEVVKVEDLKAISGYKVFMTPALVIDGAVKVTGKVAAPDQIKKWILGQ